VTGSPELAGAVLYVADVDRAARFYAAVLGTDVVDRGDRFAVLTLGAAELSLVAMPPEVAETPWRPCHLGSGKRRR
jgi:catechol 2,3-dioxygenase-like lactoylglutathione lyase family enzyme